MTIALSSSRSARRLWFSVRSFFDLLLLLLHGVDENRCDLAVIDAFDAVSARRYCFWQHTLDSLGKEANLAICGELLK